VRSQYLHHHIFCRYLFIHQPCGENTSVLSHDPCFCVTYVIFVKLQQVFLDIRCSNRQNFSDTFFLFLFLLVYPCVVVSARLSFFHLLRNPRNTQPTLMMCNLLKDRRRRPEGGGGEWEQIKIPQGTLAYIPKSTRHTSLLTQPRPHIYSITISLRNRVRNCSRKMKRCRQECVRNERQNSD
jgi:hypothetical protein